MDVVEPTLLADRYQVERTLGAGGMGIVYLARDTKLHRPVAIKQLRQDATSESAGARIRSEAQLLAQLNHPNIVALYDVLETDGEIALVMEFVEGVTLQEWMREHTPSLQQKIDLLMQICRGLTEAHRLEIIHRDLKPDNILVASSPRGFTAKLTDFGIARSVDTDSTRITREDHVAGTVDAMSPEQLQGLNLDIRSDLFSLGTIAYQMLCGSKPFDKGKGGSMALAQKIINEPHIPPQQANPRLPDPLTALIDRLLSKAPADRPESAEDVLGALRLLHSHSSDGDTQEFSATVTELLRKRPTRSRRILKGLAIAAGLAAVTTAGWFGWEYATRLEPQYIAVMPVQIEGEIRGEENAKALTATMVRQALMNSVSQLKASALVSFTPREGQDFDSQLRALRDKGVTDALYAQLLCAEIRCEIELQRINPNDSQIRRQTSFAFLSDKRQEAEYQSANSAANLFDSAYRQDRLESSSMSEDDYDLYLNVLSRLEAKALKERDLEDLISLSNRYPRNLYIYRGLTDVAARLYVLRGDIKNLEMALRALDRSEELNVSKSSISGLKLFLYGLGDYPKEYQELIAELEESDFPLAELKSERARNFYRSGNYREGIQEAREATELNPSAANLYLLAINLTASGDYTDARSTLNNLIKTYPDHWSSYSLLGVIELESGNLMEAEKAITSIPVDLRGWRTASNLGVVYYLQQKYLLALEEQKKVLEVVPSSASAMEELAATYLMLGDNTNSQLTFEKILLLTEDKQDLESRMYRALAYANLGKSNSAISLILELILEAPQDTDLKYSAAQIYALAGEWRSANHYLEQLLSQGMSSDWFRLPAFRELCKRESTTAAVAAAVCN